MTPPDESEQQRTANALERSTKIALALFALALVVALAALGYAIAFY